MSLRELLENPKLWGGSVITAVLGWAGILLNKRLTRAGRRKEEAEGEGAEIEVRIKKDKYFTEKEIHYQLKIDVLTVKLEEMTNKLGKIKDMYEESMTLVEELKAELNFYKTINS